jgi:para-aminobenzoate synthetase
MPGIVEEETPTKPNILFVDAYDSFTNNIISLLTTTLDCTIRELHIDTPLFETDEQLLEELGLYDAVVLGPGPGLPSRSEDVGIFDRIWRVGADIPILGICLGMQSLGLQCGATVRRLREGGLHGIVRRLTHCEKDIYEGVGLVEATAYQSLCVVAGQESVPEEWWEVDKWGGQLPDLVPLAWMEDHPDGRSERILTAMRHARNPWWGLQYHPESICTNEESRKVIGNWMMEVQRWNTSQRRHVDRDGRSRADPPVRQSLLAEVNKRKVQMNGSRIPSHFDDEDVQTLYSAKVWDLPNTITETEILECLVGEQQNAILLGSSNNHIKGAGVRGRFSIIALHVDEALRVTYTVGNETATCRKLSDNGEPATESTVQLRAYGGIWPFLANFLHRRPISNGRPELPFWGGFMGYTSYELGLEGIDVQPAEGQVQEDDLCLAWVTHSVVVDHDEGLVYLQCLHGEDVANGQEQQFRKDSQLLEQLLAGQEQVSKMQKASMTVVSAVAETPASSEYESKVRDCQSYIAAGSSYELCLTDLTKLTITSTLSCATTPQTATSTSAYRHYLALRSAQPSPFASFVRLGPTTFISCSPERFLSWTSDGRCELRPMKGTIPKICPITGRKITREEAERRLGVDKERAENLMIVDLARHDLYGVCGAGRVGMEGLMRVEEYESVWQMVSVVVGKLPQGKDNESGYSGVDVLAASLPPGSMTGAPKKRSCELLSEIEGRRRGLYSGVVGYMDVGGRGDWSVNIRCAFRHESETTVNEEGQTKETWYVGAGGAVTALSHPRAEREEMETKLWNTLSGLDLGLQKL